MATRNGVSQHLLVHSVGTKCTIGGDEAIPAVVTAVRILSTGVEYYVAWWDGRTKHGDSLEEFEIQFDSKPSLNIGFHNATN